MNKVTKVPSDEFFIINLSRRNFTLKNIRITYPQHKSEQENITLTFLYR